MRVLTAQGKAQGCEQSDEGRRACLTLTTFLKHTLVSILTRMKSSWLSLLSISRELCISFSLCRASDVCLTWDSMEVMSWAAFPSTLSRKVAFSSSMYLCSSWNSFRITHLKTSASFCRETASGCAGLPYYVPFTCFLVSEAPAEKSVHPSKLPSTSVPNQEHLFTEAKCLSTLLASALWHPSLTPRPDFVFLMPQLASSEPWKRIFRSLCYQGTTCVLG